MTGSYHRLQIGDHFYSDALNLDKDRTETIIRWGGYVHPLFTDPNYPKKAGFGGRVIPGELVLLFLGGLAEQTGAFDDTALALVGFNRVNFRKPAMIGDTIRLDMEVAGKQLSGSGRRGFLTLNWTCHNQSNEVVLQAEATVAFRTG